MIAVDLIRVVGFSIANEEGVTTAVDLGTVESDVAAGVVNSVDEV